MTENPVIDTVEIWELLNTTEDSHPIHLHLVRFQILDRRSFDEPLYFRTRQIRYTGPAVPPDPYELGWKDTIRAHSKMITRIIVRFEGYTGRYVWHCHVLEHEDNEDAPLRSPRKTSLIRVCGARLQACRIHSRVDVSVKLMFAVSDALH